MERWNLEIHFRKGIHWICFIAGKYSVWYNHGSLKEAFKFKGIKASEWKMYILPK